MTAFRDIIVVGSGAAGIAAAVTAARRGHSTMLLDQNSGPGGTGGLSGLTTLCGLYDGAGGFLNNGFAREFAAAILEAPPLRMGKLWVLAYRPERFREVANGLLRDSKVRAIWNKPLTHATTLQDLVVALNGLPVAAVIDCTGTAEVARAVGAECLETTESTQAPAVMIPLRNVGREVNTVAEAARVLLPVARAGFPPLSFQPCLEPGTLVVKFTGPVRQAPQLVDFLRSQGGGFENCFAAPEEIRVGQRAGRMIVGHYVLTGADVLAARKFSDGIARCAWPIEQWGPDGIAHFKYLPEEKFYEVPERSLRALRFSNLFMAGKTISADVDAIASARVMGCCLATGEAAGNLAANYLESEASQ